MSSSGLPQQALVLNILGEAFGDVVRTVASVLLRVEKATLSEINKRVAKDAEEGPRLPNGARQGSASSKLVRKALLVLLQQNCLKVIMPTAEELKRSSTVVRPYYK